MNFKKLLSLLFFIPILICCDTTTSTNTTKDSKEVMFICPHGAARSPIAAAYFNKIAKEQNLNYHAIFRGTEPDETLSARTIEGLTKEGIDLTGWKPELVSTKDINKAYKIVTFDCSVPTKGATALEEQWNGTPSPSREYEDFTRIVKGEVEQLIAELPK